MPVTTSRGASTSCLRSTTPPSSRGVEGFLSAGEEARFVPHLPLKLVIIDESIVLFGMEDPVAGSPDLTLLVIEHPSLAQILKIAFGAVWASGLTFEQARERLSQQETRAS